MTRAAPGPGAVRQRFDTTSGLVELTFDEETRIVSAHRFGAGGRPVAAAMESWDDVDFASVLMRQLGLPRPDAEQIASVARAAAAVRRRRWARPYGSMSLRLVAILLRAAAVSLALALLVGLFLLVVRR